MRPHPPGAAASAVRGCRLCPLRPGFGNPLPQGKATHGVGVRRSDWTGELGPVSFLRQPSGEGKVTVRRKHSDRGAAAVEMAIILPLLLLVIGGLVDFGRAYFTKVVITNAAREGARAAVVGAVNPAARATAAATGVSPPPTVLVSYSSLGATDCVTAPADTTVTVTVTTAAFNWIILQPALSLFGASGSLPSPLTATANMRCE
jgi:Flp pilus assembly protein TadG